MKVGANQAETSLQSAFEFGLQVFGEMGERNKWVSESEQVHKVGPAIFGKIPLGGREATKYNAALLKAASTAKSDTTFRMQVEYEF